MLIPTTLLQESTGLIFDQTLTVDAAAIDTGANGIPGGYKHLLILIYARTSDAVINSSSIMRFNNDSGANYDYCRMRNDNTTFTGTSDVAQTGVILRAPGDNVQAGSFGSTSVFVPAYLDTTGQKTLEGTGGVLDSSAANCSVVSVSARWRSTAAITRISIIPGTGNFRAGSRMTIYGV